jgi:hypothetical protein
MVKFSHITWSCCAAMLYSFCCWDLMVFPTLLFHPLVIPSLISLNRLFMVAQSIYVLCFLYSELKSVLHGEEYVGP